MKENGTEPLINKRILNPIDRISEILFGLIMALTFTCTISVINTDKADVKEMLIGAISCNIAWGLVDAVMFLLMTVTEKGRGLSVFNFVRKTNDINKAHQFIADALPPTIASLMKSEEIEALRKKIVQLPQAPIKNKLTGIDFKMAIGIFILVFLSTLPVAIPFVFINNIQIALRTSNAVAITMMFLCGAYLAKYAGLSKVLMGVIMSLIGVGLVLLTIALGG